MLGDILKELFSSALYDARVSAQNANLEYYRRAGDAAHIEHQRRIAFRETTTAQLERIAVALEKLAQRNY